MTKPYFEASPDEIATKLYELCGYYTPDKKEQEQDIKNLEEAIYNIKAIAQNEYNSDYYRTFWYALQMII